MIDLKATNHKLEQRAKNILRAFTSNDLRTYSDEELEKLLQSCSGSVKLAATVVMLQVPVEEARLRLQNSRGVLSRTLRGHTVSTGSDGDDLVLCVDAGGSGCKAAVMSRNGALGSGKGGPCNV